MDDLFKIEVSKGPGVLVQCRGELDICAVPDLESALAHAQQGSDETVRVDLQGVRYIDSACVTVLLRAYDALVGRGGRLLLVSASPTARRALELLCVAGRLGLPAPTEPIVQRSKALTASA